MNSKNPLEKKKDEKGEKYFIKVRLRSIRVVGERSKQRKEYYSQTVTDHGIELKISISALPTKL